MLFKGILPFIQPAFNAVWLSQRNKLIIQGPLAELLVVQKRDQGFPA